MPSIANVSGCPSQDGVLYHRHLVRFVAAPNRATAPYLLRVHWQTGYTRPVRLLIPQTRGIMTLQNVSLRLLALLMMLASPDVWATAQEKAEGLKESSYRVDASFPQRTDGLVWQATSAVAIDSRGNIFVFHRAKEPILKFDRSGKLMRAFGEGLFVSPHGMRIDDQDNLWVTDNANHTVVKLNAEGQVLLSLGVRDQAGDDAEHFDKPTDVAWAANGDFYVSDGYGNSRVVKFSREGKFLSAWGKKGTGPGEFNLPHAVQVDRQGISSLPTERTIASRFLMSRVDICAKSKAWPPTVCT